MELKDFVEIAFYGNKNWKGSFTQQEIMENAEVYYSDYLWSIENDTIAETIKTLARNLVEDAKEMPDEKEPVKWLFLMASGLELVNKKNLDVQKPEEWLTLFGLSK